MIVANNFVFLTNASTPQFSNELVNYNGDMLQLEVSGDGVIYSLTVYGKVDINSTYTALSTIKLDGFEVNKAITSNGIYSCCISGISKIKVELTSIGTGSVSVFGRTMAD